MAKRPALEPTEPVESAPQRTGRATPQPEPVIDVWSRTSSKYRVRAIALLSVNAVLFAGLGCFAYWLRSGEVFAPAVAGYQHELIQTLKFGQYSSVTLAVFLIDPINVLDVPMQVPIVGLLMAALISIPILVAILYRFWTSVPFIAVVGFLAVMPWLAFTLLGSCLLASVRPFRTRFRFVSALLGLVPAVVYLVLAWRGSSAALAGNVDPIDRIKFMAPWALAIVAAALAFAIVLAIAKMVNYRPGAITPLLALMFGLPVALFEFHVGRDELHYRLLEALHENHFADVDASVDLDRHVQRAWERHPPPRRSRQEVYEIEEQKWQFELAGESWPYESELARHCAALTRRCDWFRKYFPGSRYSLNALFIKARALDMRVDASEFRRTAWIRFYGSFPNQASRDTWRMIAENGADSVLESVAKVRLAHLDAQAGDIERAITKLEQVLAKHEIRSGGPGDSLYVAADSDAGVLGGVLDRPAPETSLNINFDQVILEAHRLYDLFVSNRDPLYGYDPFSRPRRRTEPLWYGLMNLVPRDEKYVDHLRELKAYYPNCQLEDNLDLEIAKATQSLPLKIERLEACLERYPRRDSVPEVLFHLGAALKAKGQSLQSQEAFARLVTEYPDSVWAQQTTRHATGLAPVSLTKG